MQESTGLLVGDVLLSAACIAYYGAFPGSYRQELVSGWVDKCKEYGIPVSPDCTLRGTLASPIQVPHSPHKSACMSVTVHASPVSLPVCLSGQIASCSREKRCA